jgi:hypothetical protein
MQDSEFSRIGQGYPSLFKTRRPLAKVAGVWVSAAVQAAPADSPVYLPLQTPCCTTANRRSGPLADYLHRNKRPDYSITSSASCWTNAGTVSPSNLAVLRLMASSKFVGACTGRSAGFSPLRIRSTYDAAR